MAAWWRGGAKARDRWLVLASLREKHEQHYHRAMADFRKAAAAGSANAMFNIGVLYADGQGVPQDYAKAMEWYRKGAAAGSRLAMFGIGYLYDQGQGVPQDYAKALRWMRKAEASGDPLVAALAKMVIAKIKQAQAAQNSGQ